MIRINFSKKKIKKLSFVLIISSCFLALPISDSKALEFKSFISDNSIDTTLIDKDKSEDSSKEKKAEDIKYKKIEMYLKDSCSIYEDKELKKELAVIKNGTPVLVKIRENNNESNDIYENLDNISFISVDDNIKGYIQKEHLSKEIIFEDFNQKLPFKNSADIYEKHDISSKILAKAKADEQIKVIGISSIWTKVQFLDKSIGYTKYKNIINHLNDEKDNNYDNDDNENENFSIDSEFNNENNDNIDSINSNSNAVDSIGSLSNNHNKYSYSIKQGSGKGVDVANFALKFVGGKYIWGGNKLGVGVDCSGFTREVYKRFGVVLPRTSYAQRFAGKSVKLRDAVAGDIVCFKGHVGMYLRNGKMVHASSPRYGIIVTNINWGRHKVLDVRRIIE